MAEATTDLIIKEECSFNIGQNNNFYVYYQPNKKDLPYEISNILSNVGGKPKSEGLYEYAYENKKGFPKPEYIITFDNDSDTILIVESKSNSKKHVSKDKDKPKTYAVDGVLYYAKYLKEKYNVICLAVSGEDRENLEISTFVWYKQNEEYKDKNIVTLLNIEEYLNVYNSTYKIPYDPIPIRMVARKLHDYLRELGYSEKQKPLFIAGVLIALMGDFRNSYERYSKSQSLCKNLMASIKGYIENITGISSIKVEYMTSSFNSVFTNTKLQKLDISDEKSIKELIRLIDKNIYLMFSINNTHDIIGEFYNEFIRYSGGDGKGLGIVLTPSHITDLFCNLARLNKDSTVLDICCGTGSFLVSALHKMFQYAKNDKETERIRKEGIYGVEINQELHTLAYANMIVRQDGKSNIINDDCFSKDVEKILKGKCDVGLINPPYSQKTPEIKFIERMLDLLKKEGKGIAIVPMSVAIGTKYKAERRQIMNKHRLVAVMSMPDELFYPVGVNTCIMIWEAHIPHDKNNYKTWFGYWKDDGLQKKKNIGRIDIYNRWQKIKDDWLRMYNNREKIEGKSAYEYVGPEDEWLAEAYMKTDYSNLTEEDFKRSLRNYFAYLVKSGDIND